MKRIVIVSSAGWYRWDRGCVWAGAGGFRAKQPNPRLDPVRDLAGVG